MYGTQHVNSLMWPQERCRRELAKYKVPSQLVFVDSLPRNAMSKVVKRELLPYFEPSSR